MASHKNILVSGGFDDLRSPGIRFLHEASKLGELTVLLWPDAVLEKLTGHTPKFPLPERQYFLNGLRYVSRVIPVAEPSEVPADLKPDLWVDLDSSNAEFARKNRIPHQIISADSLRGFPEPPPMPSAPGRKKIVATGCYDWLHSGHVRFMEEASSHGDLYICLGSDANVRLLKGEGHPLLSQEERRYLVGSIKFVKQAIISTGSGWVDADPEIRRLKPDIYVVNEDGDKGGKREYCEKMGLEYLVLKRLPAPGLVRRSSTDLRGF